MMPSTAITRVRDRLEGAVKRDRVRDGGWVGGAFPFPFPLPLPLGPDAVPPEVGTRDEREDALFLAASRGWGTLSV